MHSNKCCQTSLKPGNSDISDRHVSHRTTRPGSLAVHMHSNKCFARPVLDLETLISQPDRYLSVLQSQALLQCICIVTNVARPVLDLETLISQPDTYLYALQDQALLQCICIETNVDRPVFDLQTLISQLDTYLSTLQGQAL